MRKHLGLSLGGWVALLYSTLTIGSALLPLLFGALSVIGVLESYGLGLIVTYVLVVVLAHPKIKGIGHRHDSRPRPEH